MRVPAIFIKTAAKAIPCEIVHVPRVGEFVEVFVVNNIALEGYVVTVKNLFNATKPGDAFQRVEVYLSDFPPQK